MIRKKIPRTEEGFDLLLQNMNAKCAGYKTTLNISDTQLATLNLDATAYHAWRLAKNQLAESKVSVTEFVKILFDGDKNAPLPQTPVVSLGSPALPEKPGIEPRTEAFIDYLDAQENFTGAIGLDLGFYEESSGAVDPANLVGDFKTAELTGYEIEIKFSKQGQDGLQVSWRIKGTTDWTIVTLTASPFVLQITPDPNGLAVTVEMKGLLISKNKPVGQSSDVKTVIARA